MYYLIGAVLISALLYWILQGREDDKARAEGQPSASTSKRVMLFFFLLIVMTFVFYFVGNAMGGGSNTTTAAVEGVEKEKGGATKDYKANMVKNIREDVIVGLPPFGGAPDDCDG